MRTDTDFTWAADPQVRLSYYGGDTERPRPCVLILPGGGYIACAPMEGSPVARHFTELGFAAFRLCYSTLFPDFNHTNGTPNPHTAFPEPLRELAAAIVYIRERAGLFGVDPDRITLVGFSAGGHLAAHYANCWNDPVVYEGIGTPEELRPNACVLGYGATGECHPDSLLLPAVTGHKAPFSPAEAATLSAVAGVGPQTAPTFLFHSVSDPLVPVSQSVDMLQALQAAGVPCELHLFSAGGHAYGLGTGEPMDIWPELAVRFLKQL